MDLLPTVAARDVLATLAGAIVPPRCRAVHPAWLHAHHHATVEELLAAIARHGAALLADPVGSGKTYVALAVAAAMGIGRVPCVVPSIIADQWRTVAGTVGIGIDVVTHEQLSRAPVASLGSALVIVDESHRFREPATRRHRHLADAVLRSRVLLLTATPVVNRLHDLAAQLLLGLPDDALAEHGVRSIARQLDSGVSHAAFGRVVFARHDTAAHRPVRRSTTIPSTMSSAGRSWLAAIDNLAISPRSPIAALVRGVFLRAMASSPASLGAALARYRALLAHHADAARDGHSVSRAAVLQATAGLDPQIVMWSLLPDAEEPSDLVAADLAPLDRLVALVAAGDPADDARIVHVRELIRDGRPTVIFTSHRATVQWLRDALGTHRIAWCAGRGAGIGRMRVPRRAVLDLFRREAPAGAPTILVASDVAAEGLDLRRLQRVVHWDLPWTPARLEQRAGRALRAGVPHADVEVVRCDPCREIDRRLRLIELLSAKAAMPSFVGIGPRSGVPVWQRLATLGRQLQVDGACVSGKSVARGGPDGALAAFAAGGTMLGLTWIAADGSDSDDADLLWHRLRAAALASEAPQPPLIDWTLPAPLAAAIRRVRRSYESAHTASTWLRQPLAPEARRLCRQLDRLGRMAHGARDGAAMAAISELRLFAMRAHTVGEARLLGSLDIPDVETARRVARGIPPPRTPSAEAPVQLVALLVLQGDEG